MEMELTSVVIPKAFQCNNAMLWQAYIGTAPDPNDVYCIKYVSYAAVIIASVVVVSCLIFVVAVVVVCCTVSRRRTRVAAAFSGDGSDVDDERVGTRRSHMGGNVRMNFHLPPIDDDDNAR